jgi:hypothetical protein
MSPYMFLRSKGSMDVCKLANQRPVFLQIRLVVQFLKVCLSVHRYCMSSVRGIKIHEVV